MKWIPLKSNNGISNGKSFLLQERGGGVSGCTYISANGDSLIAAPLSHRYLRKK